MLHLVYLVLAEMPHTAIKGTYTKLAIASSPTADFGTLAVCFQARRSDVVTAQDGCREIYNAWPGHAGRWCGPVPLDWRGGGTLLR